MKDVIHIKGKSFSLNLLQLIGSTILFIGILGIFLSIFGYYQDLHIYSGYSNCITNSVYDYEYVDCRETYYRQTGMVLSDFEPFPTPSQKLQIIIRPIMEFLFYMVISLVGLFIFNVGGKLFTKSSSKKKVDSS